MNKYIVLFGLVLCLATVNGRHYTERADSGPPDAELSDDAARKPRNHAPNTHRRRRWQADYNYPQPAYPFYAEERRDYDRSQEYLPHIMRLLEELLTYVKRPPPPPQPLYYPLPYPVPYSMPQYCRCPSRKANATGLTFPSRLPEMEDVRQNWGFDVSNYAQDVNDGDGGRPLSFEPLMPPGLVVRPAPKVEPTKQPSESRAPSSLSSKTCTAAVITCCRPNDSAEQKKSCFTNLGCAMSYKNGNVCHRDNVLSILDALTEAYSPVNNN